MTTVRVDRDDSFSSAGQRIRFASLAAIVILTLGFAAGANAATCTAVAGVGNWTTPTMWNCGAGPSTYPGQTSGDVAVMSNTGTITVNAVVPNGVTLNQTCASCTLSMVSGSLSLTGASSVSAGVLQVSGGTLTIVNAVDTLTVGGTLNFTGGTFAGAGTVTVNGSMSWSGGVMNGDTSGASTVGSLVINPGVTMTIPSGSPIIDGRLLTNKGTINASGSLYLYHMAVLDNQGTYDFKDDSSIGSNYTGHRIDNSGTFTKSATAATPGTSYIYPAFHNTGAVNANAGTLSFRGGGTSSGAFNVNSILSFYAGTFTLGASTSIAGPGKVVFDGGTVSLAGNYNIGNTTTIAGGTVNLNGSVTSLGSTLNISSGQITLNTAQSVATYTHSGGTLAGTGALTVTGSATWSGGSMSGDTTGTSTIGSVIINPGVTMTIPSGSPILDGRLLTNQGTINASGTLYLYHMAVLDNQGTYDLKDDSYISYNYSGFRIDNSGTFTKSGTAATPGTSHIYPPFNNTGTVNANAGTLAFRGGGTSSGAFNVNSTLSFVAGTFTLTAASSITGPGNAIFDGGTVNHAGSYNVTNTTTIAGGTLNLNGTVATIGSTLIITGGQITLNTAQSVATYTHSGGTLAGSGTLTITGSATWSGGSMSGDTSGTSTIGSVIINPGVTMTIPSGSPILDGRLLTNQGTINASGTLYLYHMAVLANQGTYNLQDDSYISYNYSGFRIDNSGTFTKSGTAATPGTSHIYPPFNNTGTVNANAGTLAFRGGGTSSGAFNVNSTLSFVAGTFTLTAASSITGPGNAIFDGGTVNHAGSYNVTNTTTIAGGTLNLTGTVSTIGSTLIITSGQLTLNTAQSVATYTQSGGYLAGTAALTVTGSATWTSGYMQGDATGASTLGETIINPGVTLSIPSGSPTVDGRRLTNKGTINASGTLYLYHMAVLDNQGTYNIQDDSYINYGYSGFRIDNSGTFRKSGGTGTSWIYPPVNNSGTVLATSGALRMYGGGADSGSPIYTATAPATIDFAGATHTVSAAATIGGTGTIEFGGGTTTIAGGTFNPTSAVVSGGTAIFNSAASATNLTVTSGSLGGSGVFTVTGSASWPNGSMSGDTTGGSTVGETIINPGVTLTIPPGSPTLDGRRLTNRGTINASGSLYLYHMAVLDNQGTYDIQNTSYVYGGYSGYRIDNSGTFQKSGGTTTSWIYPPVNNSGTLRATSGALRFYGGSTGSGSPTYTATSPAILDFAGGTHTVPATATIGGTGTIEFGGGTTTIDAGTFNPASVIVSGGTAILNGTATVASLSMTSGTLGGAGTFTVTGSASWSNGSMSGDTAGGSTVGETIIDPGVTLTIPPGSPTLDGRRLTNRGTINTSGSLYMYHMAVLDNQGTYNIQNDSYIYNGYSGYRIDNSGTFQKSGGTGTSWIYPPVNNSGTVLATSGALRLYGGGTAIGSAIYTATAPATLDFAGGILTVPATATIGGSGTIEFGSGTTTIASGFNPASAIVSGGTAILTGAASVGNLSMTSGTLSGAGVLTVTGSASWSNGTMSGDITGASTIGETIINPGATLTMSPGSHTVDGRKLTNRGTINVSGTVYLYHMALLDNQGTFDLKNDSPIYTGYTGWSFNNSGTFIKSAGAGSSSVHPTFTNTGVVQANSGTLYFVDTFTQSAGATLVNATLGGSNPLTFNGGTLVGSGTITANVINNGAQVNPGSSPGTLTIAYNYTQGPAGVLNMELAGTTPGTGYDQLTISGQATLDGTLTITETGGFIPPNGTAYQILNFASRVGDFTTKNGLVYPGGTFSYLLNSTNIQLTAGACTPPDATITGPSSVCPNATATASVPATTGATYTWTVTNGSIATGQGTNTITFAVGVTSPVTVAVTVTLGGCSNSGSKNVTVASCGPTLTAVRPNSGTAAGGSFVVIDGTNLAGVTSVMFGGSAATINYVSATELGVTAPGGSGVVNIQVSDGSQSSTLTSAFAYASDDDLARDFSAVTNPSQRWSYGYSTSRGAAFVPFTNHEHGSNGMNYWNVSTGGLPNLAKNRTAGVVNSATNHTPPGKIAVHPGGGGENTVVRWTAPGNGTYRIQGSFIGYDSSYPTTTDVAVLKNNSTASTLFSGNINSYGSPLPFDVTATLTAGETIEFTVGFGNGSYSGDATGVDATISVTAPACTPPTPSITASGPTTFCTGGSVLLSTTGSGSFQWLINGSPISGAVSSSYSASASGNYSVMATTAPGCSGTSAPVTVTVNPAPNATITAPASVIANSSGNIAFVSAGSGTATYAWSISGGSFTSATNGTSVIFTAGPSGTITLGVTVSDNGCTATSSTVVPIGACTPPDATISAPSSVAPNSPGHTASVTPRAGATYVWSISGGTITSAANGASITFTAGASGNVMLNVTVNENGCSASGSATVTISCTSPNAAITAPASVVANSIGNNASVTPGSTTATYSWTITGGSITSASNGPSITFTAGASGSVTLNVAVTDNGCTGNGTKTVAIAACTPNATITAPASVVANSTGNNASATPGSTNATYSWTITGGTITSASNSPSITFTAGASGNITLTVTVTDNGCAGTGSKTVAITSTSADLVVNIASSTDAVSPSAPFSYLVTVTNSGPDAAQGVRLITNVPVGATIGTTAGPWTCTSASNVLTCSTSPLAAGASSALTINATAPTTGGSITATTEISATTPDPNLSNNSASAVTLVGTGCATSIGLLTPANNAAVSNPVFFSWAAVANATSYELLVGSGSATPTSVLTTAATSASIARPSGSGTWYVVARFAGTNCDPAISPTRTFTVAPAAQCEHPSPQPTAPANGELLPSPITFSWTGVAEATSYTVFASIDGGAPQDIGSTSATTLEVSFNATSVVWYVRANFAGCDPTLSEAFSFTIQRPDDCSNHGVATLNGPSGTTTSPITFSWSSVRGANEYRVWASIDNKPFESMGTTNGTSLTAAISKGAVQWFVESLFEGCSSTESAHLTFTIPAAASCNTTPAGPVIPSNGTTVFNQTIEFTWNPAPNAIGYELYISLASGTPTLLGSTTHAVTLRRDVAPGNLEWFVRALFNGCDPVDSEHFTFTFDPPANCPTQRPILDAPGEGAGNVTSPVDFSWTPVAGVAQYKVSYAVNGGAVTTATTTQPSLEDVVLANGAVEWSVEAMAANCPSLISTTSRFTVVPLPPQCSTPGTTDIRAAANTSSGVDYVVQWDPIPGAVLYELQESAQADFSVATLSTVTGNEQTFHHANDTAGTPAFFYYRVRGVNNCNSTRGLFSNPVVVGVLPLNQSDTNHPTGATPVTNPQPTIYQLQICNAPGAGCSFVAAAGQSFSASADRPWLSVSPATGTVPAGGITLTVTASPAGLGVGTNTGAVTVIFGGSSAQGGKISFDGATSTTTNISVNLVAPVAPTPNNTPPPDALIIPAVAHANGVNSQFESDIRVTNTSAQPMKYQLTFTPTGESGIALGKQATIDIEPGRTIALDDVLNSWFGAGASATGATGALEIRPLTKSSSSVSSSAVSGLPNIVTFATSRTYSVASSGSFGTIVPAIPYSNFIGQTKDATKPSVISLQQVAQTSSLRTNFGLKEGSGQPATVQVTMFNSTGGKIGEFTQNLTGGQHLQINSVFARQNLTNVADARIEVRVTSPTGKVTAYASVVSNDNNDAQLVAPVALSQVGSARYVLAGVADLTSEVGKTQTDVRLFNASPSAVTATLAMYADKSSTPQTKEITIGANEVKTIDVGSFFGATNSGNAAVHVSTATPANLVATARTYTQTSSGSLGQFFNAVTPANAITAGSRPLQLLQIEQSNRFSTDVGVAEVSGKAVDLEVSVIPQDSKVAPRINVSLKANEYQSMPQLLKSMGLDGSYNARVSIKVIGGAGAATAYATVTDQTTKDPTHVQAQ